VDYNPIKTFFREFMNFFVGHSFKDNVDEALAEATQHFENPSFFSFVEA